MIPNIGPLELGIVLLMALIIFGPKRLPELGRSMGRGIKEFRASTEAPPDDEHSQSAGPPRSEIDRVA